MRHAWEQLEQGDRLQASEKGWGAVVHGLKAVSQPHGWRHRTHTHNNIIAKHLSDLTGDKQIYVQYAVMETLHVNYYDDRKDLGELRLLLEVGADLLQRLATANQRIGPNPPAPSYDRSPRPRNA